MPGTMFPLELSKTLDREEIFIKVHDLLLTGRWAIDWWEGDPEIESHWDGVPAYYLRPATKRMQGYWADASYGGDCTFHAATGCELSEVERPTDCKTLIPHETNCHQPESWSKFSGIMAWYPFRSVLRAMLQYEP
jgi:hypothetical protein